MTAEHKVTCTACKGKGYIWLYVSEWDEMKARFAARWRRIWDAIKRKP